MNKTVYREYLDRRNKKIIELRRKGKTLKWLAYEFKLSIRQISRILAKYSKKIDTSKNVY